MLPRFYASVSPLRVECPRCGHLIIARAPQQGTRALRPNWNRYLSRLRCVRCNRVYIVGLLLWDSKHGLSRLTPPDTVPSRDQLSEIAEAQAGAPQQAFWTGRTLKAGAPAHRYRAAECTCAPLPWRAECPIHGEDSDQDIDAKNVEDRDPYIGSRYWTPEGYTRKPPKKEPKS